MLLPLALFAALAARCGPAVHLETLAAVARTESRFNSLAIGDNHTGRSYTPSTVPAAVATASALLARGHSLDLGLMQINSTTLSRLGVGLAAAFDPCTSLRLAADVLVEGYRPRAGGDQQDALRHALSRYNTGSPTRGLANGYVTKVQASAEQVVPALRLAAPPPSSPAVADTGAPPASPPSWDVYGQARARAAAAGASAPGRAPPGALAPVTLTVRPGDPRPTPPRPPLLLAPAAPPQPAEAKRKSRPQNRVRRRSCGHSVPALVFSSSRRHRP